MGRVEALTRGKTETGERSMRPSCGIPLGIESSTPALLRPESTQGTRFVRVVRSTHTAASTVRAFDPDAGGRLRLTHRHSPLTGARPRWEQVSSCRRTFLIRETRRASLIRETRRASWLGARRPAGAASQAGLRRASSSTRTAFIPPVEVQRACRQRAPRCRGRRFARVMCVGV
jgi:hypothetical protein